MSSSEAGGPELPATLGELLARSVEAHGDRPAVIGVHARWTYRELAGEVDAQARALVALGVGKGTRVGVWMENDPDWLAVALGAASVGALVVPVSTFAHADDLAYHLAHTDVSHLILSAGFLGRDYLGLLAEVAPGLAASGGGPHHLPELPALRAVVVRGAADPPPWAVSWDSYLAAGAAVPAAVVAGLAAAVDATDDAYLLTTSGTTARPKGVLLSHGAVAGNGVLIGDLQRLVPDDVVWFYFPLFFSAGCINVALGTLSHGAALVVQPTLDAAVALELIEREQVTVWHLWPHQLEVLMAHEDWSRRDHSRLHKGTAPYDVLCDEPPADGLGGVNMYGMTETATAFACTDAAEPLDVRMTTQGHLMAGNQLRVVDPDGGHELGVGEEGELCVKGPRLMTRYYKIDPAETFDADGFFHTGDLGYLDEDGRVHFVRRLKDVIKTGGINVSPAEVEAVLLRAPGVAAAHVFALPGGERGEVVGAALVPTGDDLDDAAVRAHCGERLPSHKRPQALLVLDGADVPMTGSGKVRKGELAERLAAAVADGLGPVVRLR